MRAVLLTAIGGYECLSVRDDVAVPTPGADEVLIRVAAAGVNNTDINTRLGWYAQEADDSVTWNHDAPTFPRIQGADACGHVVAVGGRVDPGRIGARVLIEPVFRPSGAPVSTAAYFGSEVDGAFAEFAVAPSRHAHRIDCVLSDVELASFPCSYSAAENMLTRASVVAGEHVLITGASGGVGTAALQLALARGADVYALAAADKHDALRALGATDVTTRDDDLNSTFGRNRFDVILDSVGGPKWPMLLDVLRPGGRYAACGAIAGHDVALDLRTLYLKDLSLLGCTVLDDGVFARLVRHIEHGVVRPLIAAVFPLEDIVDAQKQFLAKQHTGKIVLRVE